MAEFGSPAVSMAEPLRGYWSFPRALEVVERTEEEYRKHPEVLTASPPKMARSDLREALRSGEVFAAGLCERTGDLMLFRQQFWRAKIRPIVSSDRVLDPFDEAVEGRNMDLGDGVLVIPMIAQSDLCKWMGSALPPPVPLERPPGWPGPELSSRSPRRIPDWARPKRPGPPNISNAPAPPRTVRGSASGYFPSRVQEPQVAQPEPQVRPATPANLLPAPVTRSYFQSHVQAPVKPHPGGRPRREDWTAFQQEVTRRLALDGGT
jgi:hypothetical protein